MKKTFSMPKLTSTNSFKVAVIAAILLSVVYLNPVRAFDPLRSGLTFVFSPLQKIAYSLTAFFEGGIEFMGSIGQLKKENEALVQTNLQLESENASLHEIKSENDLLRQQLNLLPRSQYDLISSSIIAQDPNGMGNWLELDKGTEDGIAVGMPVIVSKGILLGRIQEANAKTSKVILLTNPKSTINVMDSQTGAKGIVKGEYGLGVIFDMILQTDSVQIGNEVVTSGIGEMPRGLLVGTVQEVHPTDDHLFQQAVVTTPIQISKLQIVFVIKNSK